MAFTSLMWLHWECCVQFCFHLNKNNGYNSRKGVEESDYIDQGGKESSLQVKDKTVVVFSLRRKKLTRNMAEVYSIRHGAGKNNG